MNEFWATPPDHYDTVSEENKKGTYAFMNCYILSPYGVRKLLQVASPIPATAPLDVFLRNQFGKFTALFARTYGEPWPRQQAREFPSTAAEVETAAETAPTTAPSSSASTLSAEHPATPTPVEFQNALHSWKERIFKEAIELRGGALWSGLEVLKGILESKRKVYVMGNGGLATNLGAQIDGDDEAAIIRFNDFRRHTLEETHGRRTDIQVCNVHSAYSFEEMQTWLDPEAVVVVAEKGTGRNRQQQYVDHLNGQNISAFGIGDTLHRVLFGKGHDVTRGMMGWIFAFAAFMDREESPPVALHLYGFVPGGGHQTDPRCRIGHGASEEWQLLAKLDKWFPWVHWHQQVAAGPSSMVFSQHALDHSLVPHVPATDTVAIIDPERADFHVDDFIKHKCHFCIGVLGDSTWRHFGNKHKLMVLAGYMVMVVPMHMDGHSLRENYRLPEQKIVDILNSPGFQRLHPQCPARCWNVPYRGGIRGQTEDQGLTTAEAVVSDQVAFLPPLVSKYGHDRWEDDNHPRVDAIKDLLETMIQHRITEDFLQKSVGPLTSQLRDTDTVHKVPFLFVLSDGWNKAHWRDMSYVSAYWKCRMDFGSCFSLAAVKDWAEHYVSWKTVQPAYCLPPHILPEGKTTMPV